VLGDVPRANSIEGVLKARTFTGGYVVGRDTVRILSSRGHAHHHGDH